MFSFIVCFPIQCRVDEDGNDSKLVDRDYSQYEGYWHGFTFIIFDNDAPEDQWIQSTYWVEVATGDPEDRADPDGPPE